MAIVWNIANATTTPGKELTLETSIFRLNQLHIDNQLSVRGFRPKY